jgi:hypothetical protein
MEPEDPLPEIKERALHLHRDPKKVELDEWGSRRNPNPLTDPLAEFVRNHRYHGLVKWQDDFEKITRGLNTQLLLTAKPGAKVRHLDQEYAWFEKKNWLKPPQKEEKPCPGFLRFPDRTKEEHVKGSLLEILEPSMASSTRKLAHSLSLTQLAPVSNIRPEEHGFPSEGLVGRLKQSASLPSL